MWGGGKIWENNKERKNTEKFSYDTYLIYTKREEKKGKCPLNRVAQLTKIENLTLNTTFVYIKLLNFSPKIISLEISS